MLRRDLSYELFSRELQALGELFSREPQDPDPKTKPKKKKNPGPRPFSMFKTPAGVGL